MKSLGAAALIVSATTSVRAEPELQSSASAHPGIIRETWIETDIPARVRIVKIDLTSAEIGLVATKEDDRGRATSEFASVVSAQVAINGGSFAVAGFRPYGLAVGDKTQWTNTADDTSSAVFHFRRTADDTGERTTAAIITPEVVTTLADLPSDTEGVIAGKPLLIRAGALESSFDCDDPITIACQRAPRSAIAISDDGNSLWLVTVDGWQSGSIGMTATELARFLRATKNPHMAIGLDSGGSSTLVLDGAVVNQPSEGIERPVANHLAVKFGALPRGQLTGLICKHDVIACRTDTSLYLPGAEVTLDDGRVQVVGANASYNFPNISPRLACVTVRLDGFLTRVACDKVPPGQTQFESVPMFEGVDPPDAGPKDAGAPDDAGSGLDGGLRPDGGQPGTGPGGGCCSIDPGGHPRPGLPILVTLVGFMLLRRRGTTARR